MHTLVRRQYRRFLGMVSCGDWSSLSNTEEFPCVDDLQTFTPSLVSDLHMLVSLSVQKNDIRYNCLEVTQTQQINLEN